MISLNQFEFVLKHISCVLSYRMKWNLDTNETKREFQAYFVFLFVQEFIVGLISTTVLERRVYNPI